MLFETFTHEWFHQTKGRVAEFTLSKGLQWRNPHTSLENGCTVETVNWTNQNSFRLGLKYRLGNMPIAPRWNYRINFGMSW